MLNIKIVNKNRKFILLLTLDCIVTITCKNVFTCYLGKKFRNFEKSDFNQINAKFLYIYNQL